MRVATVIMVLSAGVFSAAAASAATQPPMGQFEGAFYACDNNQAFQISYDSKSPKAATVTTSNNNTQYQLKRMAGSGPAEFSNGTVDVSISGQSATVQGTTVKMTDCKLKSTS